MTTQATWPPRYDQVFDRLGQVRSGAGRWEAHCPGHDDRKMSLSLALGTEGKLLMRCMAPCHCRVEDILVRLGLTISALFPERQPGEPPVVARDDCSYDYRDEHGKLLFQAVRFTPKGFSQRRPNPDYDPKKMISADNRVWLNNLQGVRRVLYRLPDLRRALEQTPTRWVVIVEGEKSVDLCWKHSIVATCNPMGAGKWLTEYGEHLKGANVVVIPDHDAINPQLGYSVGMRHAADVCHMLQPLTASVRLLDLPGQQDGDDFDDWWQRLEAAGVAVEQRRLQLAEMFRACPLWTPPAPINTNRPAEPAETKGVKDEPDQAPVELKAVPPAPAESAKPAVVTTAAPTLAGATPVGPVAGELTPGLLALADVVQRFYAHGVGMKPAGFNDWYGCLLLNFELLTQQAPHGDWAKLRQRVLDTAAIMIAGLDHLDVLRLFKPKEA